MRIKLVIVGLVSQLLPVLSLLDSHLEDSIQEDSVLEDSTKEFSLQEDSPHGFSLLEDHLRPYVDNGGWRTYPGDLVVHPGPCNIAIRDSSLSQPEFLSEFSTSRPLVVRDAADNDVFRALAGRRRLLSDYGHTTVTLSAANTHSYEKRAVTFREYCTKYTGPQRLDTPANETFYMFGDHDYVEWADLLAEYSPPPYTLPGHRPAYSFGVAGPGSGVPFHFHGPGWAEAVHGRKRWFLAPPEHRPEFHPNKTTLQWFLEDYDRVKEQVHLHECTIRPGEAIFFPDGWWHATLNIDTAVFISTFLSP